MEPGLGNLFEANVDFAPFRAGVGIRNMVRVRRVRGWARVRVSTKDRLRSGGSGYWRESLGGTADIAKTVQLVGSW